jgi:DNA (cytosine-5)-methyltransferase 1
VLQDRTTADAVPEAQPDEEVKYASLFAGIGGFDLAFDAEGMTCTAQVEKDPARHNNLWDHWDNVPKGDDIRDVNGADLGKPDLVAAGFPCTDLSVGKAKRKGLDGDGSGLYWEFHRLVEEHLRIVDNTRPRWTVLENVPGLVNYHADGRATKASNQGRDMAAVLMGLESIGYGWAYRVVDSRHVGSAQRRPRVVIVGHRGGDPRPAWQVLADGPASEQPAGLRGEPTGEEQPGLRTPPGVSCYRKVANPRATAAEGGWASYTEADFFTTLTKNDSGSPLRQKHVVYQHGRLRALTPVEWERLQGFPDNWTAGMREADRYKALGDAMNVDLARWLARRLIKVNSDLPLLSTVA